MSADDTSELQPTSEATYDIATSNMVRLQDVHKANKDLVKSRDLVCVAAGATSGIGEGTIRELAATSGAEPNAKALRVYIIARRPAAADALISDLQRSCPKGVFLPVQCSDLALLKDVDMVCDKIMHLEKRRLGEKAKIDLLLLTQGFFDPFGARTDTSEGLDSKVSLHFYSRMRMIHRLLPLLTARRSDEPPAQIISVYAGGMEKSGKMFPDDLSLRQSNHYGFANARATIVHMKTMFFEHLTHDYPGKLSLVHVYPGLVITPSFDIIKKPPNPLWFRLLATAMVPLAKVTVNTAVPESGQRTLFLATSRYPASSAETQTTSSTGLPVARATNGVLGGGSYSCDNYGETNDVSKAFAKLRHEGFYDKVWTHVMSVFEAIDAGRICDG